MAKKPTLSGITNVYTSAPIINANNDRIEQAFENTISRDGSTPNQMEADLDLNNNDLLNVGNIDAVNITVDGESLDDIVDTTKQYRDEAEAFRDEAETIVGSVVDTVPRRNVDTFTGNGTQTVFILDDVAPGKDYLQIFINGVYQPKSSYSVSGDSVTFSAAPASGAVVEVNSMELSAVGQIAAEYVTYNGGNVANTLNNISATASRNYTHRDDLVADLIANQLSDGDIVSVHGVFAVIDSTATGDESALHDLGEDGVRLLSNVVEGRWWTSDNIGGDQADLMIAANTYALAVASTKGVILKFDGQLNVGSQVNIGAAIDGFGTDFSGATIDVIAGTILTTESAIIVRGRRSTHIGCIIDCHRLSAGWEFRGCTQSTVTGHNAKHHLGHGCWVLDSNANAKFIGLSAYEWFSDEPEFADWNNFVADGIKLDGKDFSLINPTPGYCKRPIYLAPDTLHVTITAPHPYNGDPRAGMFREYPYIIVSDALYDNDIDSAYLDNGMVLDNTGRLKFVNCRKYSNAAAVLPDHQVLVQIPDTGPDQLRGSAINCRTSFGFYNLGWMNSATTEPIVIFATGQSNMVGNADAVGGLEFVHSNVRIWGKDVQGNGTAAWINPVYGTVPLQLGGECLAIDAANRLAEMTGRMVYVVLMARGGHNCESFIPASVNTTNGWTPTTNLAATMYAEYAAAIATVPGRTTTRADFFLWHQGEANSADSAATYRNKFAAVIDGLISNTVISNSNTRMVAGGLLEGVSHRATIETAVRNEMTTRSQLRWAGSDGLAAGNGSTVHFSGTAIRDLAWRYVWAAIEWGSWSYNVPTSVDSADEFMTYRGRHTILGVNDSDTITRHEVINGGNSAYIQHQYTAGSGARVIAQWGSGQVRFFNPSTNYGFIGVSANGFAGISTDSVSYPLTFQTNGVIRWRIQGSGNLLPESDNSYSVGAAGSRMTQIWATSGVINTSDAREKQDVQSISDAVLDAWADVEFIQYRWIAAVAEKGDDARVHVGFIAQQIESVFAAHGLDPFDYALLCRDDIGVNGDVTITRYGVRMDQCIALEMALSRRTQAQLQARLDALESA